MADLTPFETVGQFRSWLAELREQSGLSHDALAEAVGDKTTRRQTIRWLKTGVEPRGYSMVKLLTALGVELRRPALPKDLPKAVNAELRALNVEVEELRAMVLARDDAVMAALNGLRSDILRRLDDVKRLVLRQQRQQ